MRYKKFSSLHGFNVAADVEPSAHRSGVTHLEAVDGVGGGQPRGTRVLLGAKRSVEGPGDGTQVEGAHGRSGDAVPSQGDRRRYRGDAAFTSGRLVGGSAGGGVTVITQLL